MRKFPIAMIKPGMAVARTLYAENGNILLRRGVELTERLINALEMRGFSYIFVFDGIADDVEPDEVISESVRAATSRHVHALFNLVDQSAPPRRPDQATSARIVNSTRTLVSQLSTDVNRIVDEILTAETLTGVSSIKSHDNYTFEHSIEVTVAGVMLGRRLNLVGEDIRQLALGCILHDIGKTAIPTDVLNKPARLTDAEFALVKRHPQVGYEAVADIIPETSIMARHVVWQHHERQDGLGYPRGLRGRNNIQHHWQNRYESGRILLGAEIAAVADVYSALASDRPYRPAMATAEIVATMTGMSGSHLNQEVVLNFLQILPVYPVGTEVVITSGGFAGYRGVVVRVDPKEIERPRVRLLRSPDGRGVEPQEILLTNDGLCLAAPEIKAAS